MLNTEELVSLIEEQIADAKKSMRDAEIVHARAMGGKMALERLAKRLKELEAKNDA